MAFDLTTWGAGSAPKDSIGKIVENFRALKDDGIAVPAPHQHDEYEITGVSWSIVTDRPTTVDTSGLVDAETKSGAQTKADAAQVNATAAATTDATSKANNAQAAAIAAAAADASTKAGTAQANAIAAATTKADSAQATAISAAATDATMKADSALATAIATASSDATLKANAAQANAIASSAADATIKANASQAAALAAAATDATTKANNAQANAITAATEGNSASASKLQTARMLSISGDASGSASFDGSADSTVSITLAAEGTPGTYTKVTTDSKGRVTSGTTLSSGDIPKTLDNTWITDFESEVLSIVGGSADVIATANTIPKRDTNGKLAGDILGNAATATMVQWTGVTGKPDLIGNPVGVTKGDVLIYGDTGWERFAAGVSGAYLKSGGLGAYPTWDSPDGSVVTAMKAYRTAGTSTFTVPAGITMIYVSLVGGGGGGAAGNASYGGNGGNGGGFAYMRSITVTPGQQLTVTVPTGGSAGVYNNGAGGTGGTASFGGLVSAAGGAGGSGSTGTSTPGSGSAGWSAWGSGGSGGATGNGNGSGASGGRPGGNGYVGAPGMVLIQW